MSCRARAHLEAHDDPCRQGQTEKAEDSPSIEVSLPGTVLRNEGLVLGLRTEIVPAQTRRENKDNLRSFLASIERQSSPDDT